jgi:hypothetical protein
MSVAFLPHRVVRASRRELYTTLLPDNSNNCSKETFPRVEFEFCYPQRMYEIYLLDFEKSSITDKCPFVNKDDLFHREDFFLNST